MEISSIERVERTASQPESSSMSGKGGNPQEKIPCPKCGKRVQRRYLKKHERSISSCRFGATAQGRALGMESSPPLAPSQGYKQETMTARRRSDSTRPGAGDGIFTPLSLPVRDASRGRRWRYHEGTSGTNKLGAF